MTTEEKLLILEQRRSDALDAKKEEEKRGCDCEHINLLIYEVQNEIDYINFSGHEYISSITPTQLEVINNENAVNPYVFKSSDYLLEDFVETIECNGMGSFTVSLTSVVGQKNRVVNIINSSESPVTISAYGAEQIGNNGDSDNIRQLAVGDSVTLKSNGIATWRIS